MSYICQIRESSVYYDYISFYKILFLKLSQKEFFQNNLTVTDINHKSSTYKKAEDRIKALQQYLKEAGLLNETTRKLIEYCEKELVKTKLKSDQA